MKPLEKINWTSSQIIITPSNNYAFVANNQGGTVFVIDLRQSKAIKKIEFWPYGATIRSLALGPKPKP